MKPTKVIFRRWKGGDVIALFPEIPSSYTNPYLCQSYEHVGQHGSADPQLVIQQTKPAKPHEYHDLLRELERIGYEVAICSRQTQAMDSVRLQEMRKPWSAKQEV